MNNTPKISVIIPVCNNESTLRTCLETVLLQNLQDIEVICINAGSSDGSFEILSDLLWTDERLRIINEEHKCIEDARYTGLKEAKGEYIAFIDPYDKYSDFKALESLYDKAKYNNALVCGGCFTVLGENKMEQESLSIDENRYSFMEDRFYTFREFQYDRGFHRFIFDRNLVMDIEAFFPTAERFQDPVWFVKVLHKAERFFGISENVYTYCNSQKKNVLDKEKVVNIISGVNETARFAVKNGYDRLLELLKLRLVSENAEIICPFICDSKVEGNEEITKLLFVFEEVTGFKKIDKDILTNIISKRDSQLASKDEELKKLHKNTEEYIIENKEIKEMIGSGQTELKQLTILMEAVLKELGMQKRSVIKTGNLLAYPYFHTTHEKDGIKWTDLGDGRVEATGKAERVTSFALTPPARHTNFKTNNKRFRISAGAPDVSSFTWFISGRIAEHNGENPNWKFLRDVTINDTDGFSESFEIDTEGYEYFGMLTIVVKEGRILDHVIFKPEIYLID